MQTNLLKPKIISVEALGANQAKVVMEPFERGYGHTLGNALLVFCCLLWLALLQLK